MTHKPDDMPDEIPEAGSKMADKKAAAMGKNFASENMSIGANAAIAGAGFGGRTIDSAEHCKDCCCARSWQALGISEYTGKSIPEHIEELKLRADRVPIEPGWVLVPVEPTQNQSMEGAYQFFKAEEAGKVKVEDIYKAMLRAAPPAPPVPSDPLVDVLAEALQTCKTAFRYIKTATNKAENHSDYEAEVVSISALHAHCQIERIDIALAQYNARVKK